MLRVSTQELWNHVKLYLNFFIELKQTDCWSSKQWNRVIIYRNVIILSSQIVCKHCRTSCSRTSLKCCSYACKRISFSRRHTRVVQSFSWFTFRDRWFEGQKGWWFGDKKAVQVLKIFIEVSIWKDPYSTEIWNEGCFILYETSSSELFIAASRGQSPGLQIRSIGGIPWHGLLQFPETEVQRMVCMKMSREQDGLRSGFDKPCHNSRDIFRLCHNSRDVFCQSSNDMVVSYIQVVSPRSWSTCVDWGGILRIQEGYIGGPVAGVRNTPRLRGDVIDEFCRFFLIWI